MRRATLFRGRSRLIAVALLIGLSAPATLCAALEESASRRVSFHVLHEPVAKVATNLSMITGVPVTAYGTLQGDIENWSAAGEPLTVFADFADRARLFFAYDGERVLLCSADEIKTTVINLGGRTDRSAITMIHSLYPLFPRGAIRFNAHMDAVIARGPPPFLDSVRKLLLRPVNPATMHIIRAGHDQEVQVDR